MRYDRDKTRAGLTRSKADLNTAVHRELRRLISAEGERIRARRLNERHHRNIDESAFAVENRREFNEADSAAGEGRARCI